MDDKTLLSLVEKFGNSDMSELELNDGTINLVLRKGVSASMMAAAPAAPASAVTAANPAAGASPAPGSGPAVHLGIHGKPDTGAAAGGGEAITSPIVGTFYRASGPDTPAFVEAGTKVKAGDTLCILEAMKMMNHLEAEFDCEILAVAANNGDLVEYGQTLFEVRRI